MSGYLDYMLPHERKRLGEIDRQLNALKLERQKLINAPSCRAYHAKRSRKRELERSMEVDRDRAEGPVDHRLLPAVRRVA